VVRAEVFHQPPPLIEVERDPFIAMHSDMALEPHGELAQRQQPLGEGRDGSGGFGMDMQDAVRIGTGGMDGAMDHEAGAVHRRRGRFHGIAVERDLHE
jgi:hypothetical protein